jgi:hypothetical protein
MHFDGPRSAYLLSSGASITCFVFVNGATPFLLQYLVDAPDNVGAIAGSMVLVDEMLALPLVLVWGYLIDRGSVAIMDLSAVSERISCSLLACCGYFRAHHCCRWITAHATSAICVSWPALDANCHFSGSGSHVVRPLSSYWKFGHSALTTTLSAGIALLAGPPPQSKNALDNEEQPLLATTQVKPEDSARLSGYVGLACGCGALLAGKSRMWRRPNCPD